MSLSLSYHVQLRREFCRVPSYEAWIHPLKVKARIINYHSIERILERLVTNDKSLTEIYLRAKLFSPDELATFVSALRSNTTVKELVLEDYMFRSPDPTSCLHGASLLAAALEKNSTLTILNLRGSLICGAAVVADFIKLNSSIKVLSLSCNKLMCANAKDIANALKNNKSLVRLYLSNNIIKNAGAASLSKALRCNDTIKALHLGQNPITDCT